MKNDQIGVKKCTSFIKRTNCVLFLKLIYNLNGIVYLEIFGLLILIYFCFTLI